MYFSKIILLVLFFKLPLSIGCSTATSSSEQAPSNTVDTTPNTEVNTPVNLSSIKVGAARFEEYLSLLERKKVGMVVNQTSVVNSTHLVDVLLSKKVAVMKIFAPEHGFRGTADAGQQIKNGRDTKTGLPIISLYGKNKKPTKGQLQDLDVVVFDIQDVGARFYTYISTMHYVMEACAENGIPFIVLDRPNPNGHYVDGPILDPAYQSFVGMHPVPVVHGMTVGEYAQMVNGEGWLSDRKKCNLTVITASHYSHDQRYELPIKPSPNLPNQKSIYLYPSLCFLEGTTASAGRGTEQQFQIYGHPDYSGGDYEFTPISRSGAKYPKHENKTCYGYNLSNHSIEKLYQRKFDLSYLIEFYQFFPNKEKFFLKNNFFDKLAGSDQLRKNIIAGKTATEIRQGWQSGLDEYKKMRKQYLLYP